MRNRFARLPQILLGRDNAFARAVAQGGLEAGAPVLKAVAYDLDVLQVGCRTAGGGQSGEGRPKDCTALRPCSKRWRTTWMCCRRRASQRSH